MAHLAWHRQEAEAANHAAEAIECARRMRNPFTEVIALNYAAMLHAFEGASRSALERGREAVDLCARHGFSYYLAMANVLTGWASAMEGESRAGLLQLKGGLDGMRRLRAELRLPYYYALQAQALGRAGLVGEALASVSNGLAYAGKNGEQWPVAELYRVEGALLAAAGKRDESRPSFRRGLDAARQSGSLAFERKISALAGRTAAALSTERL
jgi:predicted ATPase